MRGLYHAAVWRLIRIACPHAEVHVVRSLWRSGRRRKFLNYLWVEFLMARGCVRSWGGKPYWLTVDPTNFCQLHCPFCPTGAERGVRDKSEMTFEHFQLLMDRLGPTLVSMDMINWGESLLHKKLPDMIACAKSHGIFVKLDANLNDMPPGTAERLVRSGLDVLSVSIDGLTQETYQKYRVGGRLDKVLANLRAIVGARAELGSRTPWIKWQFLVFRHNEHEAERATAFARDRGVDEVNVVPATLPVEPGFLWEWMPLDPKFQRYVPPTAVPSEEELDRAREGRHLRRIPSSLAIHARRFQPGQLFRWETFRETSARIRTPRDLLFVLRRGLVLLHDARRRRAGTGSIPFKDADGRRLCKWPWAGMAVNPNGSTAPCCSVEAEDDDLGNIFTGGFKALWNGTKYRAARRHVRDYIHGRTGIRPDSDHVCERCRIIGHANFEILQRLDGE